MHYMGIYILDSKSLEFQNDFQMDFKSNFNFVSKRTQQAQEQELMLVTTFTYQVMRRFVIDTILPEDATEQSTW